MYATTYLIIEYECPEIAHMGIHSARRQPAQNNNNMYVLPSLSMPIAFLARFDFYSKFDLLFYSCPSFFFSSLRRTRAYATIHVIGPCKTRFSFLGPLTVTPCLLTHSTIFGLTNSPRLSFLSFFLLS